MCSSRPPRAVTRSATAYSPLPSTRAHGLSCPLRPLCGRFARARRRRLGCLCRRSVRRRNPSQGTHAHLADTPVVRQRHLLSLSCQRQLPGLPLLYRSTAVLFSCLRLLLLRWPLYLLRGPWTQELSALDDPANAFWRHSPISVSVCHGAAFCHLPSCGRRALWEALCPCCRVLGLCQSWPSSICATDSPRRLGHYRDFTGLVVGAACELVLERPSGALVCVSCV